MKIKFSLVELAYLISHQFKDGKQCGQFTRALNGEPISCGVYISRHFKCEN